MAYEIERKFLVTGDSWREGAAGVRISQGYLCRDPERTVRVRIAGAAAFLTIKGLSRGITRQEFEYPVPLEEASALLDLCLPGVIDKTRHRRFHAGRWWEIDEFHGANQGLVVAEVELENEVIEPERPPWIGGEVSDDSRYYNSALAEHPFTAW